jgi:hypothetical protein
MLSHSIHAQGHSEVKIDPDARKKWVKQVRKSLKQMNPDTVSIKSKMNTYERNGLIHQKFRIRNSGLITFESNDWVYVTLHSEHNDERIGDLAIARDQDGKYYYHLGHVCGGIINFVATSKTPYTSSEDFFQYFKDDIESLVWQPLKKNFIPLSPEEHK